MIIKKLNTTLQVTLLLALNLSCESHINFSQLSALIDKEKGIGASNSEEWVYVPANAGGLGLDEFYVMKYEAKAWNDINSNSTIESGEVHFEGDSVDLATHVPISIADNRPWRNINPVDSAIMCESLGTNYHLISNAEWMAIARDIENVESNWTGGSVGDGCIFMGNSGSVRVGDGTNPGDSCGYGYNYDTTQDPEWGSPRDLRATLRLSTGSEIYDFSGNVAEWVDWDMLTPGLQVFPGSCPSPWIELVDVGCGSLNDEDYNSSNGTFTNSQGIGRFAGGSNSPVWRGGAGANGGTAGIFTMNIFNSLTSTGLSNGFRCVYRP